MVLPWLIIYLFIDSEVGSRKLKPFEKNNSSENNLFLQFRREQVIFDVVLDITEYLELKGAHENHQVQVLPPHKILGSQVSWGIPAYPKWDPHPQFFKNNSPNLRITWARWKSLAHQEMWWHSHTFVSSAAFLLLWKSPNFMDPLRGWTAIKPMRCIWLKNNLNLKKNMKKRQFSPGICSK